VNKVLMTLLFILPLGVLAFPFEGGNLIGNINPAYAQTVLNASVNAGIVVNGSFNASQAEAYAQNMLSSSERERLANFFNKNFDRGIQNALERLQNIQERLEKEGVQTPGLNESITNIIEIEQNLNVSIQNGNLTEIRNYTNQLYKQFSEIRDSVNTAVRNYEKNKIRDTTEVAEGLMERIQAIINQLRSEGFNVTALQNEFNQIQLQLNETKTIIRGERVSEAAHLMFRFRDMLLNFRDDMIRVVHHEAPEHFNMNATSEVELNESIQGATASNGTAGEAGNETVNETTNETS